MTKNPTVNVSPLYLIAGGPCSCRPGRRVRWIDPPGVPGLDPMVHCRDASAGNEGKARHAIPPDAVVAIHVPTFGRKHATSIGDDSCRGISAILPSAFGAKP